MDLSFLIDQEGVGTCSNINLLIDLLKGDKKNPIQVTIRPMTGYSECIIDEAERLYLAKLINDKKVKVYSHSPFSINLCATPVNSWNIRLLTDELIKSSEMNFKGVVVHCGKRTNLLEDVATKNQIDNLVIVEHTYENMLKQKKMDLNIMKSCPILLETPAGQGTEICYNIEEMCRVFKKARSEMRHPEHMKVCIDTCHVFAAGYDPIEYINSWEYMCPDSIGLVHFNGSRDVRGSKIDRHEFKESKLLHDDLKKVYDHCRLHDIPMLSE